MKKKRHLILYVVLLMILKTHFSFGEARSLKNTMLDDRSAKWEITAKKMSYMEREGIYVAEGDVVIKRDGQVLSAQKAIYNEKSGIVKVFGDVRLEANGDFLTGERGIFDLKNYTGQITNGHMFLRENNFYIYGDVMEKTGPNTYLIKGARVTTCDGIKPDWSITSSEVKVRLEGYSTLKHAAFKIRGLPVFYVPYAVFPAKTKRQTGLLLPRLGYSNRNGLDIEAPFFWAISDQTDATFYERFMEERGLMQGFEFRYLANNDSKGVFLFDVLSDSKEKEMNNPDDVELSPFPRTNRTRYWLRSRTDQQLPLGLRARLDTDVVSDQDYLKEFRGGLFGFEARPDLAEESGRPVEEIQSPTRRSALRLSRAGQQDYSLQALASFHQRPENPANDETPQPLSGLNFQVLPRPLPGIPLFLKFDTDYDYIWREVGLKGHRISFSPELSYPIWFGRYLQFEPALSFIRNREWFDDHLENIDHQTRDVYQIKARLSSILEKTFDLEWKKAKKLKHKITPSLTYEFRVPKDEDRLRPWFEPIDVEGKINRITFSFANLLDARNEDDKGGITYAQWGTFSLSQGYDINEARRDEEPGREKNPFEPLVGILTFMPYPDLNLDLEAHWDHDEDDISFADLSLELSIDRSGGRKDRYEIDYQFVKGGNESLTYYLNVNLLYGFSAGTSLKRDLNVGRNIESSYWLDYQSQCWGVRLATEKLDNVDTVMVFFRLVGLGDLG